MTLVLWMLLAQAAMGAVDTFAHHELAAGLPSRPGARRELALHGAREAIYGAIFLALAWFEWRGLLAAGLALLLAVEAVITLVDFVEEDRTRGLPPSERVLHTLMAIGYGVILAMLAPILWAWGQAPTAVAFAPHGIASFVISVMGVGVLVWAARDLVAARASAGRVISTAPREGTVLVTGATGFIGRAVVAALLAQGRRVAILTRDARAARAQFGPAPLIFETLAHVPTEMRIKAVVNLAGAPVVGPPWTPRRRAALLQSRLGVTAALVDLMSRLERPPAVLVNASAVGYYGDSGETVLDEGGPPRSGFMSELCRRWEEAAFRAEGLGVRTCFLRMGLVFDDSGGVLPLLRLPARLGLGAVLGDGRQWTPWVHRDDVVRMIVSAIEDPAWRGPVNAVSPYLVTQADLTRALAGKAPQWLKVPAWPLKRALGEMSDLFLASQRVLPTRLWDLGFRFSRATLEEALAPAHGPLRLPRPITYRDPPRPTPAQAAAVAPARAAS